MPLKPPKTSRRGTWSRNRAARKETAAGLLFLLSAILMFGQLVARSESRVDPLAMVNGVPITYGSIAVSDADMELRLRLRNGNKTGGPVSESEMAAVRREAEGQRFAARVRSIVREGVSRRLGVAVDEREVEDRWVEMVRGVNPADALVQWRKQLEPLMKALEAVYDTGLSSTAAYEKYVSGVLTRQEWEIQMVYFKSPERRRLLKAEVSAETVDLSHPDLGARIGIRAMLLGEKLEEAVDKEIEKADPEFGRAKRERKAKGLQESRTYVRARRNSWWQEQYRKASIEIHDDRFLPVITHLRGEE